MMVRSKTVSHPVIAGFGSLAVSLSAWALIAVGCDSNPPKVSVEVPASGLAVISSDFDKSISVSLVDPVKRTVLHDDCITGGTGSPSLSFTLSADAVLPSRPQPTHDLVVIDRGNSALTWLDPKTCAIRQQLAVGPGGLAGVNPHDFITVSAEKAYVTRYNTTDSASDPGEDLLIVNPMTATVTGRIDLSSYAAPVPGKVITAQPDRGLMVAGKVYVSLGSQDALYSAAGEGRLVVVDAATDQVTGTVPLTGMKGCSALEYLAASNTLFVACGGSFSDVDQAGASGIVMVDLAVDPPVAKKIIPASTFGTSPVNFSWVLPFAGDLVFVGVLGAQDFTTGVETAPDALYALNPITGTTTKVMEAPAFSLARAVASDMPRTVFVPDGTRTKPLIHVIDAASNPPTKVSQLDANPSTHLPPREIAWY
jgi:hypothetical protein